MPIITSAVMTGRRTNSAAIFMIDEDFRSRSLDAAVFGDSRSGPKTQLTDGDNALARLESARDDRVAAFRTRDLDIAQFDGHIVANDKSVLAARTILNRRRRCDDGVLLLVERERDGDKLSRPQLGAGVGKLGLELDRSGRRVGGVVDEAQPSRHRFSRAAGRLRLNDQIPRCLVAT